MRLTLLKISPKKSRYGGDFFYLFFKGEDGKSYRTCAYPSFGNFKRCGWNRVIEKGAGTVIDININQNTRGFVDADMQPKILEGINGG